MIAAPICPSVETKNQAKAGSENEANVRERPNNAWSKELGGAAPVGERCPADRATRSGCGRAGGR